MVGALFLMGIQCRKWHSLRQPGRLMVETPGFAPPNRFGFALIGEANMNGKLPICHLIVNMSNNYKTNIKQELSPN